MQNYELGIKNRKNERNNADFDENEQKMKKNGQKSEKKQDISRNLYKNARDRVEILSKLKKNIKNEY